MDRPQGGKKMEKKEISNLAAIRIYFQKDGGRKIEMSELKALTPNDRDELGRLSKEMLTEAELYEEAKAGE